MTRASRSSPRLVITALACGVIASRSLCATVDPAALKFFETNIRPLLSDQCYKCHGEKKQKANLRLDNLPYILQGGDGGPAVVPGDAKTSLLMKAVSYEDADLQMPPDNKLEPQQIADLKKWVELGAPWPDKEAGQANVRKPGEFSEKEKSWWAFQPVKNASPPPLSRKSIHNEIDQFVIDRLQREGLQPAPPADRHEIARRIYFDLHGLPPTPEELDAFVRDDEPRAIERLVDKLLQSPRYGERWGQHWLDLVRYGESDGYRQDAHRPEAWRYRDYIIKSFNDDKPYDRFVREQLAGDEIEPDNPEVLIGTAFFRQTAYEYNQRDAEGQRTTILNEITDTTGELFLGLSFGCARCHDHKFDPILQKDYFRLQAFFAPLIWRDDVAYATNEELRANAEKSRAWEHAMGGLKQRFDSALRPKLDKEMMAAVRKFPDEVQAMVLKPEDQKTPYEKQISYFVFRQGFEEQQKTLSGKSKTGSGAADELRREMKRFDRLKPAPLPVAFIATDVGREAPSTTFKTRKAGEQSVAPGFLSILDPADATIPPMPEGVPSTGRRTALANWITQPDNPLTARVIVNRVWQHHFGRGLVTTGSDFGKLGEKPSHAELLDWLASQFVANKWSIKWLHRFILSSATWQQTTRIAPGHPGLKKDPEDRLLWRFNPMRLDAEQARDALLSLSGELNPAAGGPGEESHHPRRAVYTRKIRNSQDEFLRSFDAPNGFQSVAQRDATNTALQSLLMVNGDWPLQRSRAMATRLLRDAGPIPEHLVPRAYNLAFSRPPAKDEVARAATFLRTQANLQAISPGKVPKAVPIPADPLVDSAPFFGKHPLGGVKSVVFKPGGTFEKLRVQTDESEGDTFSIEAVIYLESLYQDAAVRTIASRWNNDKTSKGWAFGVTSTASKFQSNNLVLQLCGDDFQAATVYEVAASNIRIPLKTPYYVAAVISNQPAPDHTTGGTVTFYAKNLADPEAGLETIVVPHQIVGGYANPDRKLYIGGRDHDPRNLWDGLVSRVTIARGTHGEDDLLISKPQGTGGCLFDAQAETLASTSEPSFIWEKATSKPPGQSAELEALTDFCHALINSNEFLYLH